MQRRILVCSFLPVRDFTSLTFVLFIVGDQYPVALGGKTSRNLGIEGSTNMFVCSGDLTDIVFQSQGTCC